MLGGVATFLIGDRLVERRYGTAGEGGAMGIVVGSVVDGVPESIIFGIQIATGLPVSPSFLGAVLVSIVPRRSPRRRNSSPSTAASFAGVGTVLGFCLSLLSS